METMKNDNQHDQHDEYDFGDDGDVVPMTDPAFDAWIQKIAPTLNTPGGGAVPRLAMWEAIQRARATSAEAQAGRIAGVTPIRRKPWFLMSAVAAALLVGVAVDRMVLQRAGTRSRVAPVASSPSGPSDSSDPARLYRLAASQTLTQAEALLTAYRASGAPARDSASVQQLGRWGRDVLGSTRLLIDSPAGDDPQLRALFDDLELVLVQIIQLSGAPIDPAERELIDRALEEHDLLPRIRTAVSTPTPSGVAGVTSAD
jgi:hypothetical protein